MNKINGVVLGLIIQQLSKIEDQVYVGFCDIADKADEGDKEEDIKEDYILDTLEAVTLIMENIII